MTVVVQVHLLEAAELSRPRFKYGRDATLADSWMMLRQCPAILDEIYAHHEEEYTRACEQRYPRCWHTRAEHHEQYMGFAPGEIVTLTEFGAEYQEMKV
jgi:hypothetical protein